MFYCWILIHFLVSKWQYYRLLQSFLGASSKICLLKSLQLRPTLLCLFISPKLVKLKSTFEKIPSDISNSIELYKIRVRLTDFTKIDDFSGKSWHRFNIIFPTLALTPTKCSFSWKATHIQKREKKLIPPWKLCKNFGKQGNKINLKYLHSFQTPWKINHGEAMISGEIFLYIFKAIDAVSFTLATHSVKFVALQ